MFFLYFPKPLLYIVLSSIFLEDFLNYFSYFTLLDFTKTNYQNFFYIYQSY